MNFIKIKYKLRIISEYIRDNIRPITHIFLIIILLLVLMIYENKSSGYD